MARSQLLLLVLGVAISAAGYAVQHPAPKLARFASVPHAALKHPAALYAVPGAKDLAAALARMPEDQRRALTSVYQATGNRLLWTRDRLAAVSRVAADAADQGLAVEAIMKSHDVLATGPHDPTLTATVDVALTNDLLALARTINDGLISRQALGADWTMTRPTLDAPTMLTAALTADKLRGAFRALAPQDPQYAALIKALSAYRGIEARGGWATLTRLGDAGIAHRLTAEGYDAKDSIPRALAMFQGTHSLEPTGRMDADTLAALNVPVSTRLAQIAVNAERWRHLPRDFGREYVMVDAADARMTLMQDGEPALSMKVVLGDRAHATPELTATISAVTFNPHWDIPASIATKEVLPMLKSNPNYLAENDIVINDGPAKGTSGAYIDWMQFSEHAFPMHLRQRAGRGNALGAIKFEMPNGEDIYLHDTPARWLFAEAERRFSHGCVRLEHPEQLAARLLPPEGWNAKTIAAAIAAGSTRTVAVEKPVPVYILYMTATADDDGRVTFHDDPYGRDPGIAAALGYRLATQMARDDGKKRLALAP